MNRQSAPPAVLPTPETTFAAMDDDCRASGGEHQPPEELDGAVGRTMFDDPRSEDGSVGVLLPQQQIDELPSQALVRIESRGDGRVYLGAVVQGPFAEPDGLRADSPPIVISTVQGGLLLPRYHGRAQVEILGERLDGGTVVPPRRRPRPGSPVFPLNADETAHVLGIKGDLRLGLAEGFESLEVCVPAGSKSVFPRHLGILGTTGGGKSTTVSGLVAKAQTAGMAVVLIDTEGEYGALHEPTTDRTMLALLAQHGLPPRGIPNTHLYHLVGRETANPAHPSRKVFSPRFWAISPHAVKEILDLNEAQEDRFFAAYAVTRRAMEQFRIFPSDGPQAEREKARAATWDELDTGYPTMKLAHLYDVVAQTASLVAKDGGEPRLETREFRDGRPQLVALIEPTKPVNIGSWRALQGKLGRIRRLKVFDATHDGARALNFAEMLQPGRVSILDLSDTDSPAINNLVIAELLRGLQAAQEKSYRQAITKARQPTPALIVIEEAHEFLSAQRIKQQNTLFTQVARIARRGRKRWLGLCFVTQLPQHLPDEVLSLVNNWILHKITDDATLARLRRTIPNIPDPLWRRLPALIPGQALASFTTLTRPLQLTIDPAPCRLLMTE